MAALMRDNLNYEFEVTLSWGKGDGWLGLLQGGCKSIQVEIRKTLLQPVQVQIKYKGRKIFPPFLYSK